MSNLKTVNLYTYLNFTYSEGPGKRFSIWFQGCLKRCKGCCNQKLLKVYKNNIYSVDFICEEIRKSKELNDIEGVTFLGGEPILQIYSLIDIVKFCKKQGLSTLVFSGYYKQEIELMFPKESKILFENLDILIDGPFEIEKLDKKRKWIGSSNQNICFFSDRYSLKNFYKDLESIEIRVDEKELILNGAPINKD